MSSIVAGYFGTGLRLRKCSILRNHQSPVDFITDRYQSQILRYTVVTLQLIPSIIYLAAQVIAIQVTFNSIFELDPDASYPVIITMALILVFEWLGGLNSVALTDLFQAVVMVVSFIILPSVFLKEFGGWKELDPETYPRPESYQTLSKVGTNIIERPRGRKCDVLHHHPAAALMHSTHTFVLLFECRRRSGAFGNLLWSISASLRCRILSSVRTPPRI